MSELSLEDYRAMFNIVIFDDYEDYFNFEPAPHTVCVVKKGTSDQPYFKAFCWGADVSEGSVDYCCDTADEAADQVIEVSYQYDCEE